MPDAFLKLIASLHENTSAQVRLDQNLSNHLQMITSARQNCVLAPVLFSIAIDWILCHMTVKPRIAVGHDHFGDLVYADDTVFFVKSTAEAVSSLNSFSQTASVLGLRVSWPKTKLQNLSDGYSGSDINRCTGLASSVMSALSHIWKDRRLSLTTKPVFIRLSVLLYAAKTWTLLDADSRDLEAFHMKYQRQLLQIKWHQFIPNNEITKSTGLPSISESSAITATLSSVTLPGCKRTFQRTRHSQLPC